MKRGKNYRKAVEGLEQNGVLTVEDAVANAQQRKFAKFNESVDLAIRLNVNPKHADQQVRGTVALPNGTGKNVRVLCFVKGEKLREAEQAGADYVGAEELADKILKENFLDFEACVATPDMMRVVGKLGKVLGPRGLMPNPKLGTVTDNIGNAIRELKAGKIEFRVDRQGIVACSVGKINFTKEQLIENAKALLDEVLRVRPSSVKGGYVKSITLSSTMGPAFRIQYGSQV